MLKGVDAILHAGDISRPRVLAQLAEIAPVHAVAGNRDWGLGLPLGWEWHESAGLTDDSRDLRGNNVTDWLTKLMGIAITAAAVSFGAPFWFDLLKRLVSIRGSGPALPLARDDPKKDG